MKERKKITERMLLDAATGISIGGNMVSEQVGGTDTTIYWTWCRETGSATVNRVEADHIELHNDRAGTIPLDHDCADHPAVQALADEYAAAFGDMI